MINRARLRDDEGATLVELLVAILVIGVVLLALAGSIVVSLGGQLDNERQTVATATALQLIEQFQTADWDVSALYDDDVAGGGDDAVRWRSRVTSDGSGGYTFDQTGTAVIMLPTPSNAGDRDPTVPSPFFTDTRQGVEFNVDVYPTWADVDGVPGDDHRRFYAVASWTERDGTPRELVVTGERAPTQAEAASGEDGVRIIYTFVDPRSVTLDQDDGTMDQDVRVGVRFNQGITSPRITYRRIVTVFRDSAFEIDFEEVVTRDMTPTETDGTGRVLEAVGTVPASHAQYNGGVEVLITGFNNGDAVTRVVSFDTSGGPFEDGGGDGGGDPEPEPSPTTNPAGPVDITLAQVVGNRICVSSNKWELTQDLVIGINTSGMDSTTGTVSGSVVDWDKKFKDGQGTVSLSGQAPLAGSPYDFEATVPAGNGNALFRPGSTTSVTLQAQRTGDSTADGSDLIQIDNVPISSSC